MKEKFKFDFKEIIPYIIIIIVVVLIRTFIVTPAIVNGDSMNPTLKDNNLLLLNKYDRNFKRFDIVVLKYKDPSIESYKLSEKLVKRIIGLPGDYIEYREHTLYVNGKKVNDKFASITEEFYLEYIDLDMKKIPEGYYFVLGDNRTNSIDSRIIGLVPKKDIKGTVTRSLIPFKSVK